MAELDADGMPETSIVTTIFFTIAVLLLGVITVGSSTSPREKRWIARRSATRGRRGAPGSRHPGEQNNKNFAPKAKKQKVTPSMQASGLNRRERRKKSERGCVTMNLG